MYEVIWAFASSCKVSELTALAEGFSTRIALQAQVWLRIQRLDFRASKGVG